MKNHLRSLVVALAAAVSFIGSSFAELPARFVEYLDVSGKGTTGTQWLELDYTPSSVAKFEFKAALKDQSIVHTFFCARTDFKVDTYSLFWINWGTGLRLDYKDGQKSDAATSSGLDKPFTVVVDRGAVSVNDVPNSNMSFPATTFTAGNKLVLFGSYVGSDTTPTANFASLHLYSFKISEGNEVKYDFWPCVDENGVAGLYDLVTGKIFYSTGTADFGASEASSAGPLKPDQILVTGKPDQCGTGLEPDYGHGILDIASSDVTVRNCTIVNNRPRNFKAIDVRSGCAPKIYNNVIWGNVDYSTGVPNDWRSSGSLDNWLNNCTTTGGLPSPSNIEKDPQFVDAANGDYHLKAGSPCVNAGLNLDYTAKSVDLDGNARIYKFGLGSSKADMGCYESPYGQPGLQILVR